eukprot:900835-Prymnesium_polylepis.1
MGFARDERALRRSSSAVARQCWPCADRTGSHQGGRGRALRDRAPARPFVPRPPPADAASRVAPSGGAPRGCRGRGRLWPCGDGPVLRRGCSGAADHAPSPTRVPLV